MNQIYDGSQCQMEGNLYMVKKVSFDSLFCTHMQAHTHTLTRTCVSDYEQFTVPRCHVLPENTWLKTNFFKKRTLTTII